MEQKLHRQEADLDSHIKAITSLESEKLDLIEGINYVLKLKYKNRPSMFHNIHSQGSLCTMKPLLKLLVLYYKFFFSIVKLIF